ncbi:hypothetical protein CCMA1212_004994 [Trichoderma ghanense]|uniref:MADF domain-containing protein n=1 Tax=Trichoderma ghanense TaxID=65468 RepID=A0ABY2H3J8_9HYPO
MSQSPTTGQQEAQTDEACYPPCLYHTPEEKRLYRKLKDVYLENYTTWDAESREVWPYIVEHASLPKSTVGKITNHSIARNMMHTKVTWAHVVALRIIYKAQIFKSKKLMKLIRDKYPRSNFNTYVFHEDYQRPIKIDEKVKAEKTAQKNPVVASDAREPQDGAERPVRETSHPAPWRLNEASSGFLSDDEDVRPSSWIDAAPDPTRPETTAAAESKGRESHTTINQQNGNSASHRQRVADPPNQRKRALPEDTEGESDIDHTPAREAPSRKQRKDKPSSAANDRRTKPTNSGKEPHRHEEARGHSSRERGRDRDDKLDRFLEALTGFGESLSEHSKAVNRNSELLERLTEQIRKRNSKRS